LDIHVLSGHRLVTKVIEVIEVIKVTVAGSAHGVLSEHKFGAALGDSVAMWNGLVMSL